MRSNYGVVLFLLIAFLLSGCMKAAEEETADAGSQPATSSREFVGDCGIYHEGELSDSVSPEDGIRVRVTDVLGTNLLAIREVGTENTGPQLIKLAGVASGPSVKQGAARSMLNRLSTSETYYFPANSSCSVVVSGGGLGSVGTLVTSTGKIYSEELIRAGLADVDSSELCGASANAQCLSALHASNPVTAGELSAFLWKPVSDSNGKLAIHTGPYRTNVIVNGELGSNAGPGNGYGSLARFSRPGCGYGSPRIEVIDARSGLPYTVGGQTTFTVSNPCQRHCLQGGTISPCSK